MQIQDDGRLAKLIKTYLTKQGFAVAIEGRGDVGLSGATLRYRLDKLDEGRGRGNGKGLPPDTWERQGWRRYRNEGMFC